MKQETSALNLLWAQHQGGISALTSIVRSLKLNGLDCAKAPVLEEKDAHAGMTTARKVFSKAVGKNGIGLQVMNSEQGVAFIVAKNTADVMRIERALKRRNIPVQRNIEMTLSV